MITEKEIYDRLVPMLVEVLGVPAESIHLESTLVGDLGAESIDLLDFSFQIEELYHITIDTNEVEKEARRRLPGGEYEKDGLLTKEALAELRTLLPEVDQTKLVKGLRKMDIPSLLTVSFFVHLTARKLAEKEATSHA